MNHETEKVNRRHLLGFRRFQNAALRALSFSLKVLKGGGEDATAGREKEKAPVKVGDMKTLVSAYKEAVAGERLVLGMDAGMDADNPDQFSLRWVIDESAGPGGAEDA